MAISGTASSSGKSPDCANFMMSLCIRALSDPLNLLVKIGICKICPGLLKVFKRGLDRLCGEGIQGCQSVALVGTWIHRKMSLSS